MADRKVHFLATLVFDENSDIRKQVDTELVFKNRLTEDLQHLIVGREIKHFVVADNEAINEKLTEERKVGKCTDCNEYNQEKHYCPKFCDVIRNITKEMQDFYKGEHGKLERIEQIINEWKESTEWDIEMYDTLEEITKVLEQE